MYFALSLDADSLWTFSRFHSNIPFHLTLSHHLLMRYSNLFSEVWCYTFTTAAMMAK